MWKCFVAVMARSRRVFGTNRAGRETGAGSVACRSTEASLAPFAATTFGAAVFAHPGLTTRFVVIGSAVAQANASHLMEEATAPASAIACFPPQAYSTFRQPVQRRVDAKAHGEANRGFS